jgi:hypothetical protein
MTTTCEHGIRHPHECKDCIYESAPTNRYDSNSAAVLRAAEIVDVYSTWFGRVEGAELRDQLIELAKQLPQLEADAMSWRRPPR